jgi:hypothetical protein
MDSWYEKEKLLTTRLTDVVTSMIKVMPPTLLPMSDASSAADSLVDVRDALERYAVSGGHEIECTCSSASSHPCANPECESHDRGSSSSSSSSSADPSLPSSRAAPSKKIKRSAVGDDCVCSLASLSPCGSSDCIVRTSAAASVSIELLAFPASAPSSFSFQISAPVSAAASAAPVRPAAPRLNWSAKHGQDLSLHDYFLTLFPMFGLPEDQGGLTYGEIGLKIVERFSLPFNITKQQVNSHCDVHRASISVEK